MIAQPDDGMSRGRRPHAPNKCAALARYKQRFPHPQQSLEWRPPKKWHIASMNKDAQ